jgi:hypothetical protein
MPEPPRDLLAELGYRAWVGLGIGAAVVIALLAMQIREYRRRSLSPR